MTRRLRRIEAYGLCRSPSGVLLVPSPSGGWVLPGGPLTHGEHPADAVSRLVRSATGLGVTVRGPREVVAALGTDAAHDVRWHADRVVYDLEAAGPAVPPAAWRPGPVALPPVDLPWPPPPAPRERGQRFAAYGLATDPGDRVLLTLIAPGYPGAGRWHLPGGGTDFGEQPEAGLLRELVEETGQTGTVTGLLSVGHRHNPAALGPEGHPMDWHAVRAVFRVSVPVPTAATVTEAAGGSTARASWFTRSAAAGLPLSEVAVVALDGRS